MCVECKKGGRKTAPNCIPPFLDKNDFIVVIVVGVVVDNFVGCL